MSRPVPTITEFARDGYNIGPVSEQRRQAVLDTLHRVLLDTPWRQVSVREIARRANCSPGLIYRFYPTLEDAFDALCARLDADDTPLPPHFEIIRELLDFERHSMNAEDPA